MKKFLLVGILIVLYSLSNLSAQQLPMFNEKAYEQAVKEIIYSSSAFAEMRVQSSSLEQISASFFSCVEYPSNYNPDDNPKPEQKKCEDCDVRGFIFLGYHEKNLQISFWERTYPFASIIYKNEKGKAVELRFKNLLGQGTKEFITQAQDTFAIHVNWSHVTVDKNKKQILNAFFISEPYSKGTKVDFFKGTDMGQWELVLDFIKREEKEIPTPEA